MMKKSTADLKMDPNATGVLNGCQGTDAGVLFSLNYSIHQHALALDVVQVLDGTNSC